MQKDKYRQSSDCLYFLYVFRLYNDAIEGLLELLEYLVHFEADILQLTFLLFYFFLVPVFFLAEKLDAFLKFNDAEILSGKGKVTAKIAKTFAESEFEKYRVIQDTLYKSDFDKLMEESIKELEKKDE